MATKTVHSLILDSGPIIKNEPSMSSLRRQAEVLYTIPAVIDEIRDAVTRARVETTLLPFLKLRSPRPVSVKLIQDFARKTGDLEVLSRPDIHLMALAYELECERNNGDWRLRSVPGQKKLNGEKPASNAKQTIDSTSIALPESDPPQVSNPATIIETRGAWETVVPTPRVGVNDNANSLAVQKALVNLNICSEVVQSPEAEAETVVLDSRAGGSTDTVETREPFVEEPQESEESCSDDEGWITPSNLRKHQLKNDNAVYEEQVSLDPMQVAIITTDFAMQNVLLQMNLNLLSPHLQRIKTLKTWALRCHACFYITKEMTRQFCGKCGKPTLLRAACSTDKNGNFRVHLKKNMQWNTRGNVYSIPKPVAGSSNGKPLSGGKGGWGHSLILTEDQKEYVQAVAGARRKKERNLMDEDYLPGILSGDRGRLGGRPKIGAGRNVNSKKRK